MNQWIDYSAQQPDQKGVYEWRVPSIAVEGRNVTFFGHMRERGAGYKKVLSPHFDRWDGYRVHVPAGTQWRSPIDPPPIKPYEYSGLCIEDLGIAPCPFCNEVPTWKAVHRMSDGGILVGPRPHEMNVWWLECCQWAKTPHTTDPVAMVKKRNALIEVTA